MAGGCAPVDAPPLRLRCPAQPHLSGIYVPRSPTPPRYVLLPSEGDSAWGCGEWLLYPSPCG
eukprot:gene48989-16346_t